MGAGVSCCDLHKSEGCCDPDDCGPCCERCPTCPVVRKGKAWPLSVESENDHDEGCQRRKAIQQIIRWSSGSPVAVTHEALPTCSCREVRRLRSENDELLALITSIAEDHTPLHSPHPDYCTCTDGDGECEYCGRSWPCPTERALQLLLRKGEK